MATINWKNGIAGSFQAAAAWVGGKAPGADDTAVIGSAGDTAPTVSGQILVPAQGGDNSAAYFCNLSLDTLVSNTSTNSSTGEITTYYTTDTLDEVKKGESISGGVIDLIAGGSETALYLQRSTLGAKTTLNVNGDAYVSSAYSDTLAGRINIGLPLTVGGKAQPQPKADALGYTSALFLDLQAWGSWTGANVPATYTPVADNTGTIVIGRGSAMVVAIHAEGASLLKTGKKTEVSLPPMSSRLQNDGTIEVEAGGLFNSYVTNGNGIGQIVNNGTVDVDGASGLTTYAVFGTNVTGKGRIVLEGGTQTSAAGTVAQFDAQVAGNSFLINGGGLLLAPGQFDVSSSGFSYSGGTVTFGAKGGILDIVAPVENTVGKLFGDTIAGFTSGDSIALKYFMIASGKWTQQLVWTQAKQTLSLYNVFTTGGVQSKSLEANFTLSGTYSTSSFHVSNASWNGEDLSAATLQIITTPPSAAEALAANRLNLFSQATASSLVTPSDAQGAASHAQAAPLLTLAAAHR